MRGSSLLSTIALGFCCAVATGATPGVIAGSAVFLDKAAGVYKVRFANSTFDGGPYQSENILEVVPVAEDAAYLRLHLEFANGHVGAISGIAIYGRDSLIYDDHEPGAERCVLELVWSAGKVATRADYEKTPGCRKYHGMRGNLDGQEFPLAGRRSIRYLQRLKDSRQFKAAMEQYRKAVAAPASPSPSR